MIYLEKVSHFISTIGMKIYIRDRLKAVDNKWFVDEGADIEVFRRSCSSKLGCWQ
jgi:hypothetical protein